MDRKERVPDLRQTLIAALQGWQADMWTAMPGIIQSVDLVQQTCVVQVAVQISVLDIETGVSNWQSISPLLDCPLFFPHGGSMSITFPVAAGDEALVVFSSRCIDGWWQNGQVQPQALFRMHDLSDGFAFAGFRSNSKVVGSISATTLQIRSADGNNLLEVDPVLGKVNVVAALSVNVTGEGINLNGNTTINGSLVVTGGLVAEAAVSVGTILTTPVLEVDSEPYTAHIHTGGTLTGGHTGPPV